jgi:hypothetical protein
VSAAGEGFLSRWSRLKEAERREQAKPPEEPAASPPTALAEVSLEDAKPLELPSIDSLDKDSDFTVFMRPEVPAELRRQALAKLWRSDPVFANLDGLLEYGEDFAAPFRAAGVVATVYQVLQGMPGGAADQASPEGGAAPVGAGAAAEGAATRPETTVSGEPPRPVDAREDGGARPPGTVS